MTERNSRRSRRRAHPSTDGDRSFLPAMGHPALLPLYDPLTRLLGAGASSPAAARPGRDRAGQRVLEIGCGTGNLLLLAARRHPRATLIGLDPDRAALALARRKAARRRPARCSSTRATPGAAVSRRQRGPGALRVHAPPPTGGRRSGRPGGGAPGAGPGRLAAPGRLRRAGPHATSGPARLFRPPPPWPRPCGATPTGSPATPAPEVRVLLGEAGLVDVAEAGRGRSIFGRYVVLPRRLGTDQAIQFG